MVLTGFSFLLLWTLAMLAMCIISFSLLLSLIALEISTFMVLLCFASNLNFLFASDYFLLSIFSLFVIEGVIGLAGLISLVSFSGSDYLSTSAVLF